jgi:hypothetical protein
LSTGFLGLTQSYHPSPLDISPPRKIIRKDNLPAKQATEGAAAATTKCRRGRCENSDYSNGCEVRTLAVFVRQTLDNICFSDGNQPGYGQVGKCPILDAAWPIADPYIVHHAGVKPAIKGSLIPLLEHPKGLDFLILTPCALAHLLSLTSNSYLHAFIHTTHIHTSRYIHAYMHTFIHIHTVIYTDIQTDIHTDIHMDRYADLQAAFFSLSYAMERQSCEGYISHMSSS